MTHVENELYDVARRAMKGAFAPYSKFKVGAALRTEKGEIYSGCNVEISSYGLTMCAERVALFKAVSEQKMAFDTLAIVTELERFCPPCGACRQVLADFAPELKIILLNSTGESRETSMAALFPQAFDRHFLESK